MAITLPLDLTLEILERLPTKSLARFRCVSYTWESLINNFIVIDSIVTRRSNQPPREDPHFFFEKRLNQPHRDDHHFYNRRSLPKPSSILSYTYLYHQVTNQEQLYHEEIIGKCEGYLVGFQYVRGLVGFWCSDNGQFRIYNPTTRQAVLLPVTRLTGSLFYFFGYDPIKNQYKVLCLSQMKELSCKVFILGDPSKEWWDIQCGVGCHFPSVKPVCVNGKIYYKARKPNLTLTDVLVSFDVRNETFNYVRTPENLLSAHHHRDSSILVNYNGKLGCVCLYIMDAIDADVWVMQDAEEQEWSKATFSDMLQGLPTWDIRFAGVTNPGGEIVLVHEDYLSELALDVYYYDPKQNGLRRAEIQTTTSLYRVRPSEKLAIRAVTDHVENIMRL